MLAGAAAYPAYRWGGREGLQTMLLGAGLSWFVVVASYVALVVAFRNARSLQVVLVVGGFLVRLVLLIACLALISKTLDVRLDHLVIWLVSFYMVLVIAEAYTLAAWSARRRPEA